MEDKRAGQETTQDPGVLFDVCLLDNFRDDLGFVLAAERGDVPDHDSLEAYQVQPVARYTRRSL
ncbi:MAG: hypothetical protein WC450_05270 [Candidatus Omnitrophota bacterium]|jgi:hypothetical protein